MNHAFDTQFWEFSNERGWVVRNRVASSRPCPLCGGLLQRVPRRFIDRLFGRKQHRLQCGSPRCEWEGNLTTDSALPAAGSI